MSKDQTLGAAIFAMCLLIGVFYVVTLFIPQLLNVFGTQITESNVQFARAYFFFPFFFLLFGILLKPR